MTITSQTPVQVRERIAAGADSFPGVTSLDAVAEESHRRFMAKRWQSNSAAASAVVHWALRSLASHKDFTSDHWAWLITPGGYGPNQFYMRMIEILRPAMGLTESHRASGAEIERRIEAIQSAIDTLLSAMHDGLGMAIGLRHVTGKFPEFQPLLDKLGELELAKLSEIADARSNARVSGAEMVWPRTPVQYIRDPSIIDYLQTLKAKLKGERIKTAMPNYRFGDEPEGEQAGESEKDEAEDAMDSLGEEFEFTARTPPPPTFSPGGLFGKYPSRHDALRRAIILAFPNALFDHSGESPNGVTPAQVIGEACIAWFGSAPDTKEINAAIRDRRAEWEQQRKREHEWAEIAAGAENAAASNPALGDVAKRFLDAD